jgi:hypothetical protein
MRLTTAKFYSPNGHPYSGVGVEPHLAVHSVAKPVDGVALTAAAGGAAVSDPVVDAAVEVARRSTAQPAIRNAAQPTGRGRETARPTPRPQPRATAAR